VEDAARREKYRVAMRVVADHIRTIAFAIADGVSPGNVGRGYVIRRILRRAVRYGYQTLGMTSPFLFKLVEPLCAKMGRSFPELNRNRAYIEQAIRAEEEGFLETLGTGLGFFEQVAPYLKAPERLEELDADTRTLDLLSKAYGDPGHGEMTEQFRASAAQGRVPGHLAFLLHDTYGFPVDLTQLMAREEGLSVDMEGYASLRL
jgi:alanyl-tRNA synthetase